MSKTIPLDVGFRVADKQCSHCLFSEDRLVSPERAQEYIDELVKNQGYFICHCDNTADDGDDAPKKGVCCRGFYDALGHVSQMVRIATRLKMIRFVSLPPLPPETRSWREIMKIK